MAQRGLVPADEVRKFRAFNAANDIRSVDWGAKFVLWVARAIEHAERHKQQHLTMALPGGKSEEPAAPPMPEEEPDDPAAEIGNTPAAQFARVRKALKTAVGRATYRSFLSSMALVGMEDDEVTISVFSQFLRDHAVANFTDRMLVLWQREDPAIRRVNVVVGDVRTAATG